MDSNIKPVREVQFNVLLTSRIGYGSPGYRPSLIPQAKERGEEHNAAFHVMAGGMIDERAVKLTAKQKLSDLQVESSKIRFKISELQKQNENLLRKIKKTKKDDKKKKSLYDTITENKEEIELLREDLKENQERNSVGKIMEEMIEPAAQDLNKAFPVFYRKGRDGNKKPMKHYIVSSYAYDGEFGSTVIKRLVELRAESGKDDIIYVNGSNPTDSVHRIFLKGTNKTLSIVVPNIAVWRSKYYSTAPDRYLEDEAKRTTQKLSDIYAFGCGSSSLNRRDGERPFQRVTIPSLCKLEFPRTSENMVGVKILKFIPGQKNVAALTISLKDFVSNERDYIKIPENLSDIQKDILGAIKSRGALSIGALVDLLTNSRSTLEKELNSKKIAEVGLEYDGLSRTYDFSKDIFVKQKYKWPKDGFSKETIASFGCMHVGSIWTHYTFISQEFPKIIAKSRAKWLLSVGDHIEGMKHNLNETGEITLGIDVTTQEEFAAILIAELMLSSLDLVLRDVISSKEVNIEKIETLAVESLIDEHLIRFRYWVGNHDDWPLVHGVRPLITFHDKLKNNLFRNLNKVLIKNNLPELSMESCDRLIADRVVRMYKNKLALMANGTKFDGAHYYARRSATSSAWPQAALSDLRNTHTVYCANFHVCEVVEEWQEENGLRSSIMLQTLKSWSRFEKNMAKRTDFGAMIQTYHTHNGRGIMNETLYVGENPNTSFDNNLGFKLLLDYAKAGTWIDTKKYLEDRLR